jgi:hypothetical protein
MKARGQASSTLTADPGSYRAELKIFVPGFLPLHNNHLAHAEIWCECPLSTRLRRPAHLG